MPPVDEPRSAPPWRRPALIDFVTVAWLATCTAASAQAPPTDIDLKAAYCIEANRQLLAHQSGADTTPAAMAEIIREASDHLDRLQGYLLPRLPNLDALPLLAAGKQAESDVVQLQNLAKSCVQRTTAECQSDSSPRCLVERYQLCTKGELLDRWLFCTNLSWVPY